MDSTDEKRNPFDLLFKTVVVVVSPFPPSTPRRVNLIEVHVCPCGCGHQYFTYCVEGIAGRFFIHQLLEVTDA